MKIQSFPVYVRVYVTDTPGWGSNDQETDYETFDQITKCKIS